MVGSSQAMCRCLCRFPRGKPLDGRNRHILPGFKSFPRLAKRIRGALAASFLHPAGNERPPFAGPASCVSPVPTQSFTGFGTSELAGFCRLKLSHRKVWQNALLRSPNKRAKLPLVSTIKTRPAWNFTHSPWTSGTTPRVQNARTEASMASLQRRSLPSSRSERETGPTRSPIS